MKKVFMSILCVCSIILLCFNGFAAYQNKSMLREMEVTVVSVEDIRINTNMRSSDTITLKATVSYEENGEIIEAPFENTAMDEETKQMLLKLEEGDVISVYSTISGLSFDTGMMGFACGMMVCFLVLVLCIMGL